MTERLSKEKISLIKPLIFGYIMVVFIPIVICFVFCLVDIIKDYRYYGRYINPIPKIDYKGMIEFSMLPLFIMIGLTFTYWKKLKQLK